MSPGDVCVLGVPVLGRKVQATFTRSPVSLSVCGYVGVWVCVLGLSDLGFRALGGDFGRLRCLGVEVFGGGVHAQDQPCIELLERSREV